MGVSLFAAAAALLVLAGLDVMAASGRVARRRVRGADRYVRLDLRGAASTLGRRLSRGAVDPEDEALAGIGALATAVAAVAFGPAGGFLVLLAAASAVVARRRSRRRRRALKVDRHLPEVIDLLGLVVGAGRPTVSALSDISPGSQSRSGLSCPRW